jgi:hypothetical protein
LSTSITYRLFFLFSVVLLTTGSWVFGTSYLNEISVIVLAISLGLFSLANRDTVRREVDQISYQVVAKSGMINLIFRPFHTLEALDFKKIIATNVFVLSGLILFGVLNLLYVTSLVSATAQTLSIINGVSIFSLFVTQIGGWFFQSCMIYMFAFILGAVQPFSTYLTLLASSYVGFLIVSLITIPINVYFIPSQINAEDFRTLLQGSLLHGVLGKSGEYWSLTLVSFGIYTHEQSFTIPKSLLVSILPSVGLLLFKVIFSTFF